MAVSYVVVDRRPRDDGSLDLVVRFSGGDLSRALKRLFHLHRPLDAPGETAYLDAAAAALDQDLAAKTNPYNTRAPALFRFMDEQAKGMWSRVPEIILRSPAIDQTTLESVLEGEFPGNVVDMPAFMDLLFRASGHADYSGFVSYVLANSGTFVDQGA